MINLKLGTNFFFRPARARRCPLEPMATPFGSPGYLAPYGVLAAAVVSLFYLPLWVRSARRRRAAQGRDRAEKAGDHGSRVTTRRKAGPGTRKVPGPALFVLELQNKKAGMVLTKKGATCRKSCGFTTLCAPKMDITRCRKPAKILKCIQLHFYDTTLFGSFLP